MHQFLDPRLFDYVDPGRRQALQDAIAARFVLEPTHVIDPSIKSTFERMEDFDSQIKNSPPTEKAVRKFIAKITPPANFNCLSNAIDLSKKLRGLSKSDYPRDHAEYYFQQFIPEIEFDSTSDASGTKEVSVKLPSGLKYSIPKRQNEIKFKGIIDLTDVQLISRTDRDADLFILKIISEYKKKNGADLKSLDQLTSIYALWDTYSPVVSEIINYPKKQFKSARPNDPEYLDEPKSKSYPGGHATATAALATLLLVTSGLPDDELDLLCKTLSQAATYIATLREMAGIHFQEDSTAGLLLGFTVMQALLAATIDSSKSNHLKQLLQNACNGS